MEVPLGHIGEAGFVRKDEERVSRPGESSCNDWWSDQHQTQQRNSSHQAAPLSPSSPGAGRPAGRR